MRHLVLALMIILLPLRSWMGDAMATSMAVGQLTAFQAVQNKATAGATETIATHTHETGEMAHNGLKNADFQALGDAEPLANAQTAHECATHTTNAVDGFENSGMDCGSCSSCQACHAVALSPVVEKPIAIFKLMALPEAATLPFASAETALSQKPPIS